MSKRLAPDADLAPERWQEILAVVVEDQLREDGFDAETTAVEAGLSPEETAVFLAWVQEIEIRSEAHEIGGTMRITTERMLEWLKENPGKPLPERQVLDISGVADLISCKSQF